MRHTLLLAASAAALMAAPALAQEATPPATDEAQPPAGAAVEQPAATATEPATEGAADTQVVTATGGDEAAAAPAAPAAGTPVQALTLAAERLREVADQIQGSDLGTEATGTTAVTDGTAGAITGTGTGDATDVTADSAAAATADGTVAEDGTTTTTIVTAGGGSGELEGQATEALDQFDGALQQYGASPEGQPAAEQVALIQQQSQQVRGQIEDDPQAAAEGMQEMAQAALQLQTAQIPAEADSIIGKQIVSSDGEEAGEVADVLITPDGQVNALLITRGGALGLGGQQVALQWSEVVIQGDQLTANLTADQIGQLPEYQTD